jgi:hypothetical protein
MPGRHREAKAHHTTTDAQPTAAPETHTRGAGVSAARKLHPGRRAARACAGWMRASQPRTCSMLCREACAARASTGFRQRDAVSARARARRQCRCSCQGVCLLHRRGVSDIFCLCCHVSIGMHVRPGCHVSDALQTARARATLWRVTWTAHVGRQTAQPKQAARAPLPGRGCFADCAAAPLGSLALPRAAASWRVVAEAAGRLYAR